MASPDVTCPLFKDDVTGYIHKSIVNERFIDELGANSCQKKWASLVSNLSTPPLFTTLRVNTIKCSVESAMEKLQEELEKQYKERGLAEVPKASIHPILSDTLVVPSSGPHQIPKLKQEICVDTSCGMAVLRGANVFAQGILAAPNSMNVGSEVSVYAALDGKCRKGLNKPYDGLKRHVGNGVATVSRHQLFVQQGKTQGIGINMTCPLYTAPGLAGLLHFLLFPQNLPSALCAHVLDPRPGDIVLDMCAAPGGKTCHIATLMQNEGRVYAFDKTEGKVAKIRQNAENLGITIIEPFAQDARNIATNWQLKDVPESADIPASPPFPVGSFRRILLDAPCSSLGQRPCLRNNIRFPEVTSFPPLQKQLMETAVSLLAPGGVLVYSTCTIPVEENEGMVAWALKRFPRLTLQKQEPYLGKPGWPTDGLSVEQRALVQRFDPSDIVDPQGQRTVDTDTIGFFIAKFVCTQTATR